MIGSLMNMEEVAEWKLAEEIQILAEKLPHIHFVYPNLGSNLGHCSGNLAGDCI
jgi:hypothetical protein